MADESNDEAATQKKKPRRRKARAADDADSPSAPSNPASSAGLAGCMTGLILFLLVLATVFYVWIVDSEWVWGPWRLLLVGLLLIVIPIVVFRAVTLWIMGEGPRFVDIDFSWRAGMEALAKQGMNIKSAPLFVIIGGGSEKLRKNMMAAVGSDFRVNGVPDVPAPLHWYASDNAIYLYLDDVAWTNLAARQHRAASRSRRGRMGPSDGPRAPGAGPERRPIVSTLVPGAARKTEESSGPDVLSGQGLSGSELPNDHVTPSLTGSSPGGAGPRGGRPAAYLGTLSPGHVEQPDSGLPSGPTPAPASARRARPTVSEKSSLQLRRLEAVCAKLRYHRQPVCPLNGILILLPFDLLQASRPDIEEVERALSADLATAQRELQLRCPVTALIVAMEQERGFCELIRRIGREHAARQRFGQRFDIRREPSAEELRRFSTHVSGVFEDWVYTLFRDDQVLSHPGNPALYNLLCKVRRSFQARLSDVLSKGFGYDPQIDSDRLLFSGCYFAATGSQPERQAFVSGVLSKLREEQEDLEWTDEALQADARRGRIAAIGWGIAGLLGVATVVLALTS
jgi:ImcF (intracellular multiplication and macrophage-killing)-related protein